MKNELLVAYEVGMLAPLFPAGTWVLRVPGNEKNRRYINLFRKSTSVSAYVAKVDSYYKQFWKMGKESLDVRIPPAEPRTYKSESEARIAGERVEYNPATGDKPTVRVVIDFHLLVRKPGWLFGEDDVFSTRVAGVNYALATFRIDAPASSSRMKGRLQYKGLWEPMLRGERTGLLWTKKTKRNGREVIHIVWSHLRTASQHLQQWTHDNWESLK